MSILPYQQHDHVRTLGGECEGFQGLLVLYDFPEDEKAWVAERDAEIDTMVDGLRKAAVSWANRVRDNKVKAARLAELKRAAA